MTDERWTVRARLGNYRALDAASEAFPMDWAVEGLLPATGATVWFGSGSTGKTQLLLWLAAHIAARGKGRPSKWLGAEVKAQGHVLVLSAEDLREHLFQRIGMIARWMATEQTEEPLDVGDICSRIHVMPFLSMSQDEFGLSNPCLFERSAEGRWSPSPTLVDVERFLKEWNENASREGRPEDCIVGVVLDSAVSMAGFEMSNSEATTNFLFHINRMSRRQGMFWAIIGHTPKDVGKKADEAAVERLRGSAMWSTTPRSVVEVRVATSADNTEEVLAANPGLSTRDIVFVTVAKANSQGADLRPRALRRVVDGAFVDITEDFPALFQQAKRGVPGHIASVRDGDSETVVTAQAWYAIADLVEKLTDGGKPDVSFTRTALRDAFALQVQHDGRLAGVLPAHEGKHSRTDFSLAWYLYQFKDARALQEKNTKFFATDLSRLRRQPTNDAGPDALSDAA